MKTKNVKVVIGLLALVAFAWTLSSCSKSNDAKPADKSVLVDSIASATDLIASTVEGTEDGQFPDGSKATLQAALDQAETLAATTTLSQAQVNAALAALNAAMATYRAAKIVPVAVDALVAHWSFSEGTGLTTYDASANGLNGSFKAGPSQWGSKKPVWTADRKGMTGSALQFNNGASVEVPYNTKLNPAAITLIAWVRVDTVNANNRFLGLWSWNGYKFQLQDGNRPFATLATSDNIFDRDAAVGIPDDKAWHHLAVTYVNGTETFYIDGVNVKSWTDVTGTAKSISATPYNLVIGADFPVDKYNPDGTGADYDNAASPWYHVIPLAWGGHFIGALDEVRIYNTALTDSQITTIYNRED